MASVSVMQGTPYLMNDSIFSLLDESWYLQSILNHSVRSSVPSSVENSGYYAGGFESETALRSSEEETNCSSSVSMDDGHDHRRKMNSERRRYSLDESEMREVFDRFDQNADGVISGEELRRYMRCCGKAISDAEAVTMISCVDRNRDGAIDFEEFLSLYQIHCSGGDYAIAQTEEEEEDNKKRAGENEVDEESEEDLLLETFRVFDRNHDGFISAQELQAVLLNLGMQEGKSLVSCERMIHKVDRNGDGQCDIREFHEMMSAQSF